MSRLWASVRSVLRRIVPEPESPGIAFECEKCGYTVEVGSGAPIPWPRYCGQGQRHKACTNQDVKLMEHFHRWCPSCGYNSIKPLPVRKTETPS